MSQSASQASIFYKEVAQSRKVWTIRDKDGYPAPENTEGKRSQPFWSSLSRVEKIISSVEAYTKFKPVELSWDTFSERWVPGLTKDKILIGVNWSGSKATGYDIEPAKVKRYVESQGT